MAPRLHSSHHRLTRRARPHKALTAGAVLACVVVSRGAAAQSIDYGALEELFGEPVTTSVTGSPQRQSEVPADMEIITANEIRRSGAYDLPGVLRHVLGIDFLQWSNDQPEIGINGYDQAFSQRVLVLVDGRQVYADYFSFTPWSTLPVELADIRQIEVVRGPGSALFGFNAVAGVINIVTYHPLHDDVNEVSVSGGTQGLAEASAVATVRAAKAGLRISGGVRSDDDFSTPLPAGMDLASRRNDNRRSIDVDGAAKLSDSTELTLEASRTQAGQNQVTPVYSIEITRFATDSVRGQLSWDGPIGLVTASAYSNWIEQLSEPGILGMDLDFTNRVSVAQLQDIFKPGTRHIVRAAIEYRDDSAGTTPFRGAHVFYHVLSASGMWEWQIATPLTLTNAIRLDDLELGRDGPLPSGYPFVQSDWNRSIREVSFNSGLVLRVDDLDTVRLTAGRGVLLPNLLNLGARLAVTPGFGLSGSPEIDPTIVSQYEINWTRRLTTLDASLRLGVFRSETRSVQDLGGGFSAAGGVPYSLPLNVGSSNARGVESALDGTLFAHWRWGANIRWETVSDAFLPFAAEGTTFLDFDDSTPTIVANVHLGWSAERWEADTYAQYVSSTQGLIAIEQGLASAPTPVPAYVEADARVAYHVSRRVTAAISGQNLLHSSQRQTSGPAVERRVLGTLTIDF
jgi:outer membrane receptor for ferrienterochelin and colicins